MANKELVYLSDVRRILLRYEPEAAYTLEGIRRVDAVEVVRCKDCKHYVDSPYDNGDMMCDRWGEWIFPNDDDFCSCGERRCDNEAD